MSDSAMPTDRQLVRVALRLFARNGYDATSTRAIAGAAGTNISSIAYHFGGKEGLRLACADAVATRIEQIGHAIPEDSSALSPAEARLLLRRLLRRLVTVLAATPVAEDAAGFMLRELGQPDSPVLGRVYDVVVERRHRALCGLWAAATGRPADSEDVKLAVFAMVGQAAYFRLAAPIVQRRMGWNGYSREAARAIGRRLLRNLDAMMDAERRPGHG